MKLIQFYNAMIFYQIQSIMYTPNKKKDYRNRPQRQSFTSGQALEFDFIQFDRCQNPQKYAEKQNIAKSILIEIGESELLSPEQKNIKNNPITINSWVQDGQSVFSHRKVNDTPFSISLVRNTKSVNHDNCRQNCKIQPNTIEKLKLVLKKLQSPQKKKKSKQECQKQNKTVILESLIRKRTNGPKVGDLIRLRQCSNDKQKPEHQKMPVRKIYTSNGRHGIEKDYTSLKNKPLQIKLVSDLIKIKEARKSRTLKNILQ